MDGRETGIYAVVKGDVVFPRSRTCDLEMYKSYKAHPVQMMDYDPSTKADEHDREERNREYLLVNCTSRILYLQGLPYK